MTPANIQKQKYRENEEKETDKGREQECGRPVCRAITHQASPLSQHPPPSRHPEKTKQCPDMVVEGSWREGWKIKKPDVKH